MTSKEPIAPKLACIFHKTDADTEPVRDWLLEQSPGVKKKIGDDIRDVQYRWPVGRPLVGMLGAGLFEVRTSHFDSKGEEKEAMSENKHHGSSFESFLVEEGIFDEVDQGARKRVLAEQLRALMKRRRVTPTVLATRMSTSRAAVYRLLDAEEGTTLDSLERATRALGADLVVKIVTRARTVAARRARPGARARAPLARSG
jgi:antitoxin HicB